MLIVFLLHIQLPYLCRTIVSAMGSCVALDLWVSRAVEKWPLMASPMLLCNTQAPSAALCEESGEAELDPDPIEILIDSHRLP